MISLAFIVSTHNDPLALSCCLASIRLQKLNSECTIRIYVTDNSTDPLAMDNIMGVCRMYDASYYLMQHKEASYGSSAALLADGLVLEDYICFASSDGYYVPGFTITMLEVAQRLDSAMVYCNCLYDPRLHGRGVYSVLDTVPEMRWIDKTSFIVRRTLFKGWPPHPKDWRDGALVEEFVKDGHRIDKAKGVLVVHN